MSAPAQESAQIERESLAYTHYTESSELFVEFNTLVMGEESPFAAHLTDLADFSPVTDGKVTVVLSGGGQPDEQFEAMPSPTPGIFRPVVKPSHAGRRELIVTVQSRRVKSSHALGSVQVYSDLKSAPKVREKARAPGEIAFLKEQQWQVTFATAPLEPRPLRASLPATGVLRAPSDAEATISATSSGILVFPPSRPLVGHAVERGQLLASIVPRLAERGDMATLVEESQKAQLRHDLAHREQDRQQMLYQSGVVAQRQVLAAHTEHQVAHAELDTAGKRLGQYRQPAAKAAGTGIPLKSPIHGVIAKSFASDGRSVNEGERLFQIVDRGRLWLEARVPEADAARLVQLTGASFIVDGFDEIFDIHPGENGRLVSLSIVIDPSNRTLPVVFELDRPDPRLPLGAFAKVRLFTGQAAEVPAVPETALVDDNGVAVVFVQTGGESFGRRPVKLGVRDGECVEIKDGVSPGDGLSSRALIWFIWRPPLSAPPFTATFLSLSM